MWFFATFQREKSRGFFSESRDAIRQGANIERRRRGIARKTIIGCECMRHILHICNVIYNSSHCIRNCVDVVGHPRSPHFPDHHGWTIEAVQDRLGWSSRVYSLFGPPWMTKSSEQRQNSGAGRVGMTLHATRSECGWRPLGVNSTRNAPKRARIGPGSGRDARKKSLYSAESEHGRPL